MEDDGQLLHQAKELKELFKCAKCQQELIPPISHCISGHEICSQCKGSSCPFCSARFAVSSKLMERVFELLPKPCKYSDRGCSSVSVTGRHEPICEFRTIKCRVGADNECTWSGTVKDWKEHVESEHTYYDHQVYCERIDPKVRQGERKVSIFVKPKWNVYGVYLDCDKKKFLFCMVQDCGEVHYIVFYVPVKSVKYDYLLKVTCENSSTNSVLYKSAVKVQVLMEDIDLNEYKKCSSCGTIFIDELEFSKSSSTKMKFTLMERELDEKR